MKLSIISSFLSLIFLFISTITGCSVRENDIPASTSKPSFQNAAYTYNIPKRYYSDGIKNIVKRSRQLKEISWTPLATLDGFNSDYCFEKGKEVIGIPYSQPVTNGKFVIYQISLEKFISESQLKNGPFYTEKGEYEEPSTYYGMDCSALVSYAWNCKNRLTAKNLSQFGDLNGNSINNIQVGDALIKTDNGAHAVLVTGIKENSKNKITWIEITEQTPPLTKRTAYGIGELFSLEEFTSLYLKNGFKIYRNTDFRDNTPFVHSCASPIDEFCEKCYSKNEHRSLEVGIPLADNFLFTAEFASLNFSEINFSYSISHIHLGTEKYVTDKEHYIKLRDKPGGDKTLLLVKPGTFITIFEKYYDDAGELWGKTRYENKVGWLYLNSSECKGGEVNPGKEIFVKKEAIQTYSTDNYKKIYKCLISVQTSDFPKGKKIQFFAHDSSGNSYCIGEYLNP